MPLPKAIHPIYPKKRAPVKLNQGSNSINGCLTRKFLQVAAFTYLIATEITVKRTGTVSNIGIVTISTSKVVSKLKNLNRIP